MSEDQTGEAYEQYDDEGILPDDVDRPLGVTAHGTTWAEEAEGAHLSDRLAAELPEDDLPDEGDRGAEAGAMREI
jgi:hypothetical protein